MKTTLMALAIAGMMTGWASGGPVDGETGARIVAPGGEAPGDDACPVWDVDWQPRGGWQESWTAALAEVDLQRLHACSADDFEELARMLFAAYIWPDLQAMAASAPGASPPVPGSHGHDSQGSLAPGLEVNAQESTANAIEAHVFGWQASLGEGGLLVAADGVSCAGMTIVGGIDHDFSPDSLIPAPSLLDTSERTLQVYADECLSPQLGVDVLLGIDFSGIRSDSVPICTGTPGSAYDPQWTPSGTSSADHNEFGYPWGSGKCA